MAEGAAHLVLCAASPWAWCWSKAWSHANLRRRLFDFSSPLEPVLPSSKGCVWSLTRLPLAPREYPDQCWLPRSVSHPKAPQPSLAGGRALKGAPALRRALAPLIHRAPLGLGSLTPGFTRLLAPSRTRGIKPTRPIPRPSEYPCVLVARDGCHLTGLRLALAAAWHSPRLTPGLDTRSIPAPVPERSYTTERRLPVTPGAPSPNPRYPFSNLYAGVPSR